MVQFTSFTPEAEESIDQHVQDSDVGENALKIIAQKHQEQHKDGKHKVRIKEDEDKPFSDKEESVIKKLSNHDEGKYKLASADEASGMYARGAEGGGAYGHQGSHQSEASCTCGWRATPDGAIKELLSAGKVDTGVKYESDAGKISYSSQNNSLEGMANTYSSPLEQNQMNYH